MKPDTYTQLLIHYVFAVKHRNCLLNKPQQTEVWKYMGGTITGLGHKCIIVNGISNHVHALLGLNPVMSISDLARDLKRSSALFIEGKNWFRTSFNWQGGYGAFSYSKSQLKDIYTYIENQEEHHRKKTFKEEYLELLKDFGIEYNEKYLFTEI